MGMVVANAECEMCLAKYLAWIDERPRLTDLYHAHDRWAKDGEDFIDLSFRSSFNDEPGPDDLPEFEIRKIRVSPYNKKANFYYREWCTECGSRSVSNPFPGIACTPEEMALPDSHWWTRVCYMCKIEYNKWPSEGGLPTSESLACKVIEA